MQQTVGRYVTPLYAEKPKATLRVHSPSLLDYTLLTGWNSLQLSVRISLSREKLGMENSRTITDLPFEVLDLIFKELNCLRYKVDLGQTHEKLGKAFAFHSRNEFRILRSYNILSDESFSFIIQECGTSIEEVNFLQGGFSWSELIAESLVKYCPNLRSVTTYLHESYCNIFQSFLIKKKNSLTSVKFTQQNRFPLEILKVFGEISQLKNLSLNVYADENVYHIEKCLVLEKLELDNHYYVHRRTVKLQQICAPLKNLRDLSLTNLNILPLDEPCSTIWARLETLALIQCEFSELPNCPQLSWLKIYNPTFLIEDYGLKFILKNGGNLKRLGEDCVPPISPDGFLQVLRGCPKLRSFYTRMEYIKLYSGYVSAILDILKDNGVTREDPLELVICRRIKWKWFQRLLRRAPNAELIDLYQGW